MNRNLTLILCLAFAGTIPAAAAPGQMSRGGEMSMQQNKQNMPIPPGKPMEKMQKMMQMAVLGVVFVALRAAVQPERRRL